MASNTNIATLPGGHVFSYYLTIMNKDLIVNKTDFSSIRVPTLFHQYS